MIDFFKHIGGKHKEKCHRRPLTADDTETEVRWLGGNRLLNWLALDFRTGLFHKFGNSKACEERPKALHRTNTTEEVDRITVDRSVELDRSLPLIVV